MPRPARSSGSPEPSYRQEGRRRWRIRQFQRPPTPRESLLEFVYRLASAAVAVLTASGAAAAYGAATGWNGVEPFLPVVGVIILLVIIVSEQLRELALERLWGIDPDRQVIVFKLLNEEKMPELTPRRVPANQRRYRGKKPSRSAFRRVVGVGLAALLVLTFAPLLALISLLIKLTSRGPIIVAQKRIGIDRRQEDEGRHPDRRSLDLGGRPFPLYRFRTLNEAGEVTQVGRFLRSTSLDELPQFLNVLRGDMNLVGPRPEKPETFARMAESFGHEYRGRQRVRPGLTGLSQIKWAEERSALHLRDMVLLDLEYVERQSVAEDLRIMAMTLLAVLKSFRQET